VRGAIERTFGEEPVGGHSIALTVSCGLASYPEDGLHASEIVSRADEALYGAKRAGRNRIGVRYRDKRSAVRFPAKPSVAVNLSRTGVLRVEDAPVSTGDEVRVSLSGFEATARVVRVERGPEGGPPFRVGAVFDSPLSDDVVLESVVTHAPGRPARGTSRR
jgi:predicted signal transduction protein with EAL and GGDEF domain